MGQNMKCSIEKRGKFCYHGAYGTNMRKNEENPMKMTTLCYIEKDGKYLMLHRTKKQHDINKDKWIGVGGHAEGTEGPEDCLLREVKEETGLTLTSYQFRGLITFISDEAPEPEEMCLFTADGFTGELIECNEGDLQWMDKKKCLRFRPGKEMPFFKTADRGRRAPLFYTSACL